MCRRLLLLQLVVASLVGCGADNMDPADDAGAPCATDVDCDDATFCTGVIRCLPASLEADSRGCVAPPRGACLQGQVCSEAEQTCVTDCASTEDADGDGHRAIACGGDDCDDADPLRFPGNTEVCDPSDRDEDCDPLTFGYRDQDSDGSADARCCNVQSDGSALCGRDCNDLDPTVNPNTTEACDEIDNDCDGGVDEGVLGDRYPDLDGDGSGDSSAAPVRTCTAGGGLVANNLDCDDNNGASHPGAPEICDLADNDCDGTVDEGAVDVPWYVDSDGDTFGDGTQPSVLSCVNVDGYSTRAGDCDDGEAATHPGAVELCDRADNDCSSGGGVEVLEDMDNDGQASPLAACSGGPLAKTDCNDGRSDTYLGATELCDRLDNDCSTAGAAELAEDVDGDLHAAPGALCDGGYPKTDCDDTDAAVHPGAAEVCDRVDSDCSTGGGVDVAEDADDDGHAPLGAVCSGGLPAGDCDDDEVTTYPGASEMCDRVDSDCSNGGGVEGRRRR